MKINIVKIVKARQNIGVEHLQLPTEEEIRGAMRQGEDATAALISSLIQIITIQAIRIQALEDQLMYDSPHVPAFLSPF